MKIRLLKDVTFCFKAARAPDRESLDPGIPTGCLYSSGEVLETIRIDAGNESSIVWLADYLWLHLSSDDFARC